MKDNTCPLCKVAHGQNIHTKVYYEDSMCIVLGCESCHVPMVVYKTHSWPNSDEILYMMGKLKKHGSEDVPDGKVDLKMRTITDHWHAHLRPK